MSSRESSKFGPSDSPRAIRSQVLRDLLSVVDADAALYFSIADLDGHAVVSDVQVAGDSDAERLVEGLLGRRDAVDIDRLQNPDSLDPRSFQEGASLPSGFAASLAAYGVSDRLRLFVYDGRRFVGWLGALRFAPNRSPFQRSDRRRLAPLVPALSASLLEADALARATVPLQAGFVAMHVGGDVEYASLEGQAWLRRVGFSMELQRRLRFIDAGGGTAAIELAQCRFVPLVGARPLFLVQLSPARSIEASAVRLSPAQREVASFAASGATVAEIASASGRKPETVRSHLREAYTRLGVSNRVELARALAA
jgi:DNA-binding CsgD family transcriptional regulator